MDKKKYKYENNTVYITIFLLALFIAMPPLARILYPAEDMVGNSEERMFLICSKEEEVNDYSAASNVVYINGVAEKNSINIFDLKAVEKNDEVINEISPAGENASDIIVLNREDEDKEEVKKTIYDELNFFRNLQGVNFTDNRTSFNIEVNRDSLIINDGNEELKNYLQDIDSQEAFYIGLGYSCYRE